MLIQGIYLEDRTEEILAGSGSSDHISKETNVCLNVYNVGMTCIANILESH